jgi:hypothetical protein
MFPCVLTPREQGDIGEMSAASWLASRGAHVAFPFGSNPFWDLIAELGGKLLRVQVKSSTCFRKGRWEVTVCTRGGNQSWNGLVKTLDRSRFEYLFVLVGDGRQWFIPAEHVQGGSGLLLGGPKYAEFEVEAGDRITDRAGDDRETTIGLEVLGGCPSG